MAVFVLSEITSLTYGPFLNKGPCQHKVGFNLKQQQQQQPAGARWSEASIGGTTLPD
ncbi:hypothetical protein SK128_020037, partial [Halocaridina rubra]